MNQLTVDPIRLELGFDLVPLAKQDLGGTLVEQIARLRQELLFKIGIMLWSIRLRDNFEMEANKCAVFIKGIKISEIAIDYPTNSLIPTLQFPDATNLIIGHLRGVFLINAAELMDYEQLNLLLQKHAATYPNLIVEFNRTFLQKSSLLKIFRSLLRDGLSIHNFPVILEALLEIGPNRSPERVAALARNRLEYSKTK